MSRWVGVDLPARWLVSSPHGGDRGVELPTVDPKPCRPWWGHGRHDGDTVDTVGVNPLTVDTHRVDPVGTRSTRWGSTVSGSTPTVSPPRSTVGAFNLPVG